MTRHKESAAGLGLMVLLVMTEPALAASVSLGFAPQSDVLTPGGSQSLSIVGDYTGSGHLLGGALDLHFDAGLVSVTAVTLLVPADIAASPGVIDNLAGQVTDIGFADFDGVAGSFTLASIDLQGLAAGTSALVLSAADDPYLLWVNDVPPWGEPVTLATSAGSVSVTAVPAPGSLVLLGSGALALGLGAWRRGTTTLH